MAMRRLVDFPALYTSTRLAKLSDEHRAEYVWCLGIMGPQGVVEYNTRVIWATAYAPIRDKVQHDVEVYLEAFKEAGLLLTWEQGGKCWAYFVGSEKPGRLPRESWKKRYAKSRTLEPLPPANLLLGNDAKEPTDKPVSESRSVRELVTDETCDSRATAVNVYGFESEYVDVGDGEEIVRRIQDAWPIEDRSTSTESLIFEAVQCESRDRGCSLSESGEYLASRVETIAAVVRQSWPKNKWRFLPLAKLMREKSYRNEDETFRGDVQSGASPQPYVPAKYIPASKLHEQRIANSAERKVDTQ